MLLREDASHCLRCFSDLLFAPYKVIPVSYTHLDVYKRQVDKSRLVFAGQHAGNLLNDGKCFFFFDGPFRSCLKQFTQLYTVHFDLRSAPRDTKVYAVLFTRLLDKMEAIAYIVFIFSSQEMASVLVSKIKKT